MKLIYIDESGYSQNWQKDLDKQRYLALAGVVLCADCYSYACQELRANIQALNLPKTLYPHPIGLGSEIKASSIAKGKDWWHKNTETRNRVRDLMLSFPDKADGEVILVIIDKKALNERYANPHNPVDMAMRYLFERIQWLLTEEEEAGICFHDQDKTRDDYLYQHSMRLIREGSTFEYYNFYEHTVEDAQFYMDRIVELHMGNSKNSIGLQVADFYARCGRDYFRSSDRSKCTWWKVLRSNLYIDIKGRVNGAGLKLFPESVLG
ncbi:MAG: DUF3800 domain-containing protein [Phaeodactylibacter sp.]|nr:DUF3800 domain-containing protein [Phaeodactylibacter sp.]